MPNQERALLCGEIVYGLSSRWWVADESNAKLQAAEHFFAEGHKEWAFLLGEKWWKSVKGDRNAAISISTKEKEGGGFVVNLPVFWAPVEGDIVPQIKIYHHRRVSEVGTLSHE